MIANTTNETTHAAEMQAIGNRQQGIEKNQ
jgi:hypothetical protein